MLLNYDTLTIEQLEEHVESVDWSLVPSHLLTEEIKRSFCSLSSLNARLWFENLLSKMEIKKDLKIYPVWVFCFVDDEWHMQLNIKNNELYCSYDKIWSFLRKKYGLNDKETQLFIKNVVEMHFRNMEVTPLNLNNLQLGSVEMHFKNMEVTPKSLDAITDTVVEMHFKSMEVTPQTSGHFPSPSVEAYFKSI